MKDINYYKEQIDSLKQMSAQTTNHLQKVRDELASTNNAINQSVAYAKKIQDQLLPHSKQSICSYCEFKFEVKQKDTIGGDFIYITEVDEVIIFGLMDCTGHGIPGALLSMFGYNTLNEINLVNKLKQPNLILEEIDKRFQSFFSPKKGQTIMTDGMDGVLCSFNTQTQKLYYSMAGRPLWIKLNGKWHKYRPDRTSIGGMKHDKFILHEVSLKKDDQLFLFSDGLTDQFGGPKNKKFLTKRLYEHLEKNNFLNLDDQVEKLNNKLNEWQGNEEQTDDISYLAVQF